jgi:hypothetical protein
MPLFDVEEEADAGAVDCGDDVITGSGDTGRSVAVVSLGANIVTDSFSPSTFYSNMQHKL